MGERFFFTEWQVRLSVRFLFRKIYIKNHLKMRRVRNENIHVIFYSLEKVINKLVYEIINRNQIKEHTIYSIDRVVMIVITFFSYSKINHQHLNKMKDKRINIFKHRWYVVENIRPKENYLFINCMNTSSIIIKAKGVYL